MSAEQKPGDPADKAADGAFGGVQSHRAGYGDDKLARLTEWLRAHPTATLASGEGALLLAEIDRLRDDLREQADLLDLSSNWADWAKGEMEWLRSERDEYRARFYSVVGKIPADMVAGTLQAARDEYLKTLRILAALREPSDKMVVTVFTAIFTRNLATKDVIRTAVAAAEQEVGHE